MPSVGDILGEKYLLERFLGSGGFASVWAARNIEEDRPVAVKLLAENLAREASIVSRFFREAKLAGRKIHDSIVRVEDVGETDEAIPFLVMELLEGKTLSDELRSRGFLPISECIEIGRAVLSGMAAAHVQDIIHRDLKPDNIFLTTSDSVAPRARILDLGLAKDFESGTDVTTSGQWMGTVDFLAPELFTGDKWSDLGPAGDVYALGVVLFEMLTGCRPLDGVVQRGSSPSKVFRRISFFRSQRNIPKPSDIALGVPQELDAVIAKALALSPEERFLDAIQMSQAMEAAVNSIEEHTPHLDDLPAVLIKSKPRIRVANRSEIGENRSEIDCSAQTVLGDERDDLTTRMLRNDESQDHLPTIRNGGDLLEPAIDERPTTEFIGGYSSDSAIPLGGREDSTETLSPTVKFDASKPSRRPSYILALIAVIVVAAAGATSAVLLTEWNHEQPSQSPESGTGLQTSQHPAKGVKQLGAPDDDTGSDRAPHHAPTSTRDGGVDEQRPWPDGGEDATSSQVSRQKREKSFEPDIEFDILGTQVGDEPSQSAPNRGD